MELAKPRLDIGLSTNRIEPMLAFWQQQVGLPLDHVLPVRKGQRQHRHDALGSVVKINHHDAALPDTPPSGYRELLIARPGRRLSLKDPDGNLVALVEPGTHGIHQIGIRLAVRDLEAHRRFYREAFGFAEAGWPGGIAFNAGETVLLLEQRPDAPDDAAGSGPGWRYLTVQVYKVDEEHRRVLAAGGREAVPPVTLGTTARISMVRDPDGNWIELSQRASLVGRLD